MSDLTLSIVIPTYGREQILIDTITMLLQQAQHLPCFGEIIIVDQSPSHQKQTDEILTSWDKSGHIRWVRLEEPNLTHAMNFGTRLASSAIVLFTDDDIIPGPNLLKAHIDAHQNQSMAWAVVGQVLQPGETPEELTYSPSGNSLVRFLDFPFRRTKECYVENAMAGNLSVKRHYFFSAGGFDERFPPPVAVRFESEFAKRVVSLGGKIWYDPTPSIQHLRAKSGGTRVAGHDLSSISPVFGVGDFYFALRCSNGLIRYRYIMHRLIMIVATRFHLRHPWYIPIKLIGEIRALMWAFRLYRSGPIYASDSD